MLTNGSGERSLSGMTVRLHMPTSNSPVLVQQVEGFSKSRVVLELSAGCQRHTCSESPSPIQV